MNLPIRQSTRGDGGYQAPPAVVASPGSSMIRPSYDNLTSVDFRLLTDADREDFLASLTPAEASELLYKWSFWRRANQVPPAEFTSGDKSTWLILAGRGYGKTRTGAEQVRQWIKEGNRYVNLIGPTAGDIRDAMIEGESGILAVCPDDERPTYVPTQTKLIWPNGAISLLFTAEEPDRLRNKQHQKLWCDELAAWRYPAAFDQAMFGLRLGKNPQSIVTTTPRPTKLVKELLADPTTVVTRGTTYDNKDNLAASFYAKIVSKYEGTRLGRQELRAEVLDDNPNALFQQANFDKNRVFKVPDNLVRVVVAIDPAVTASELSDETGIIVNGEDNQNPPHYYVFEDHSGIYTPNQWAKKAVGAYHANKADKMIGEANNGGDLVEANVHNEDPNVAFKKVHASRGKVVRAEPIAGLYEQNRVHHVGVLGPLEDQMSNFNPQTFVAGKEASPDRMDANVWGLTELSDTYLGQGLLEYFKSGQMEKDVKSLNKIASPTSMTAVAQPDNAVKCEGCESTLIQVIGNGYRCGNCGKQWAKNADEASAHQRLLAKFGSRKVH